MLSKNVYTGHKYCQALAAVFNRLTTTTSQGPEALISETLAQALLPNTLKKTKPWQLLLLMMEIMQYFKDAKLWELWYFLYYGDMQDLYHKLYIGGSLL